MDLVSRTIKEKFAYIYSQKLYNIIVLLFILLFTPNAFTQTAESAAIISSFNVDPGLMGRTIRSQPEMPAPTEVTVPGEAEAVRASGIQPADAKRVSFVFNGVRFKGNCVFSNAELFKIFKPYIGKKLPLKILFN